MSKTLEKLTPDDWEEVRQNQTVIESWGLGPQDTTDGFKESVYAVKFNFEPQTMPNYRGEVILLLGDNLEPLILVRDKDQKLVASYDPRDGRLSPLKKERIFITVLGDIADVDDNTVPPGIDVEIIDIDNIESDHEYIELLSPVARSMGKSRSW